MYWRSLASERNDTSVSIAAMITVLSPFQGAVPPSRARNREWLQKFEALHGTSQDYRRKISDTFREGLVKNDLLGNDIEISMQTLLYWTDENCTAQLEKKREQILVDAKKARIPESEDVFLPLPLMDQPSARSNPQLAKINYKTRGDSQPEERVPVDDEVRTAELTAPAITVSKRSRATFRYIFPTALEERQKHVDWETFVTSVTDAGLVARNGGGSIVTFEDENGGGKIIFHRPHPDPSIDPIMLQSMGRRMNKWFGWSRESFALAGKVVG